jgi:hypothetical protein
MKVNFNNLLIKKEPSDTFINLFIDVIKNQSLEFYVITFILK